MALGYRDALDWLFAQRRGDAPRDPARMARLLQALDLTPPPHLVHVVGTNGKGTVSAMLDAGLRAAGRRSGRFLSPHVQDFRERIAIDGRPVGRDTVRRFVERARGLALEPRPAFFEWTLALALSAFRQARVPWAVIEAGVGGARDATRALEPVELVVLTNVALDHLDTLGPDLASIARDKAGALRPGVPLITAAEGEALAVVRAEAALRTSPVHVLDPDDPRFALPAGVKGTRAANARLAAAALRLLEAPEGAVEAALRTPPLPGRGERFLVQGRRVLLDGAHDPAAAAGLAAELEPGYVLLFGALARKQGAATLAALQPGAAAVVLTEAAPAEGSPPPPPGSVFLARPERALEAALQRCPEGGLVVAAGSLYLAGRLRPLLLLRQTNARRSAEPRSTRHPGGRA